MQEGGVVYIDTFFKFSNERPGKNPSREDSEPCLDRSQASLVDKSGNIGDRRVGLPKKDVANKGLE